MSYRYKKSKTPYSKMSLSRLKEIEAEILSKNPELDKMLNFYQEEEKKIHDLRKEYNAIKNRILEIQKTGYERKRQEYQSAGIISKFLMDKTKPKFTESENAEIEKLTNMLSYKFKLGYDINKYQSQYYTHKRLTEVQKHIHQKEKKDSKRKTDRAIIASYKDKSRKLASKVKSALRKQLDIDPYCPYCGKKMIDEPHCDHIYPLSKGGLSIPKNMIFICSDCNQKKSGLTLNQFIKKYNLLRFDIEEKLDRHNKDY